MIGVENTWKKISTYCLGLVSLQLKQWSAFQGIDGRLIT